MVALCAMNKILLFFALSFLFLGCMSTAKLERLEKTMDKVPINSLRDEQTQKSDHYTFVALHVPAFGTWDMANKPDVSKAGLTIGNWSNRILSFDIAYLYSLGDRAKKKLFDDDAKQVKNLARHDLKVLVSLPLFEIPCRELTRPFIVKEYANSNYLLIQKLKFETKVNLNFGFENRYNLHGTHNEALYPGQFSRSNVTQVTQDVRMGLSLSRRVNYKYLIDYREEELKGRYLLSHEFIVAYRLMLGSQVSDIKYRDEVFDETTGTAKTVDVRKNPADYLKKNIGGMDFTYRVHFGRYKRALITSDFSAGTYTGYYDKTMDRFYFRLRFAVGLAFYKPKMSWE